MAEREFTVRTDRLVGASPARVWALVADTNRWDRANGLSPGSYRFRVSPEGTRERVGTATQWGLALEWVEPPYEWVEGRFIRGERRFSRGPVGRGGFRAELRPEDGGRRTRVETTAWIAGDGLALPALWVALRAKFKLGTERYLDAVEAVLSRRPEGGSDEEDDAAVARARRELWAAAGTSLSGEKTAVRERELGHLARVFDEDRGVSPEARERLVRWLRERPDEDVEAMRPFELALAWGLDRRDTLRAFLHATRAGLVDLQWRINCPVCRVGAATAGTLSDVRSRTHCDACEVSYETDFADHVEAVFRPSEAVRPVEARVYCASSPWFRPHVYAALGVAPGEVRSFRCRLPRGTLLARALGGALRADADLSGGRPARLALTLGEDGLRVLAEGRSEDGGSELTVANETRARAFLQVERAGWSADAVAGSVVASFPDFLDLFATEAPAAGVELSVSGLTVLFSDLTGSTALYQSLGDARAFALVQAHFRAVGEVIARHGGAVVKTMGDAVMATFARLSDGVAAALEMARSTREAHGAQGLALKVGVHAGPCLAVRANERLDYFGTTVNLAARLQCEARAGQVVLLSSALAHPDVAALADGCAQRHFEASLKGIRGVQSLVSLDA